MTVINWWLATVMLQYHPLVVLPKASLGSSREVAQDWGVSFVNCLYLVTLIISQKFCATCTTKNQTWTDKCGGSSRLGPQVWAMLAQNHCSLFALSFYRGYYIGVLLLDCVHRCKDCKFFRANCSSVTCSTYILMDLGALFQYIWWMHQ